ncbi:MAG: alpha/beta fold hydrolase [Candidatus Kapabacteria bacterium]|nr:alpha/beta fold hydrolase [Candidatus Kapabacteria bacterium]
MAGCEHQHAEGHLRRRVIHRRQRQSWRVHRRTGETMTLLRSTIGAIAISLLLASCSMDSFLFNAQPLDAYTLSDSVIPTTQVEPVTLASDGNTLHGFYVRQPDSLRIAPHYVVIYNHGNKHNINEYWDRVELLYKAGFDVFMYDYRGFGRSEGAGSEQGLFADATAAYEFVRARADSDSLQIAVYGYSLGGVPASYQAVLARDRCRALVMEACFASGEDLVRSGTLLDIPGSYLLDGAFDNAARMAEIQAPVMILHGQADTYLGIERHGLKLFSAAHDPKVLVPVAGGAHNNVPYAMGVDDYLGRITAFIRGN